MPGNLVGRIGAEKTAARCFIGGIAGYQVKGVKGQQALQTAEIRTKRLKYFVQLGIHHRLGELLDRLGLDIDAPDMGGTVLFIEYHGNDAAACAQICDQIPVPGGCKMGQ